jgi:hypothetical protein
MSCELLFLAGAAASTVQDPLGRRWTWPAPSPAWDEAYALAGLGRCALAADHAMQARPSWGRP